jgi:hypothetical protein
MPDFRKWLRAGWILNLFTIVCLDGLFSEWQVSAGFYTVISFAKVLFLLSISALNCS